MWKSRRVALMAAFAAVVAGVGFVVRAADPPGAGEPCPRRPRTAAPIDFHFRPGLQEHESWLEFRVPEPDATGFSLCFDGRLFATGVGQTPTADRVRVSVPTRWVDVQWLRGSLASDSLPALWELEYTTYSIDNG
jgi:hypothetical protein